MSKKTDLQFDNINEFLHKYPMFSITQPIPNYAAIRAVLSKGQKLEGVTLVEKTGKPHAFIAKAKAKLEQKD